MSSFMPTAALNHLRWCVQAAVCLFCSACGPIEYSGIYVANHPFGNDTLVLRADSTDYHTFRTPQGTTHVHEGQWSGWSLKEFDRIDVQNFDWHMPGVGAGTCQDTVNSSWPARVERDLWGKQTMVAGYQYAATRHYRRARWKAERGAGRPGLPKPPAPASGGHPAAAVGPNQSRRVPVETGLWVCSNVRLREPRRRATTAFSPRCCPFPRCPA